MSTTYQAVLQGNHIEWKGESPRQSKNNQRVEVVITIPDESATASNGQTANSVSLTNPLESRFRHLADQWRNETKYLSSLSKMALHPAYQKIIGLGQPAVPLILSELQKSSDHWLWALHSITGEDPAQPNATFREAVESWIEWGKLKGYLT
ncbi:MAG: hypothetical protein M3X11_01920 [Acidobacteriota bacterium]|nr:hypothetical protein [Acidobacteriota bacterium]